MTKLDTSWMIVAIIFLLSALSVTQGVEAAHGRGGAWGSLFRQEQLARMQVSVSPRVVEKNGRKGKEWTMDIPGASAQNLSVQVLDNGNILSIRGTRTIGGRVSPSQQEFEHSIPLDKNIDTEKISVDLSSKGILRIKALYKEDGDKRIPIQFHPERRIIPEKK